MSKQTFFPYRMAEEELNLQVEVVGSASEKDEMGRVHAYRLPGNQIRLKITVHVNEGILNSTLATEEQDAPPVALHLTLRSIKSRLRKSIRIDGVSTFAGLITLQKEECSGALELRAHLIRTTPSPLPRRGLAKHSGAVLANSLPMYVLFDESPTPPVGGVLDVRWEEFATSSHEFLHAQKENLFALDSKAEVPVLYLNKGLQWAQDVLGSEANSGRAARHRDFTNAYIAQKVWTVLLVEAMQSLSSSLPQDGEAGTEDLPTLRLEALTELPTWQRDVLIHWAPSLMGQEDLDTALRELSTLLASADWPRELVTGRLPDVLQRSLKTGERFTQVASEVLGS